MVNFNPGLYYQSHLFSEFFLCDALIDIHFTALFSVSCKENELDNELISAMKCIDKKLDWQIYVLVVFSVEIHCIISLLATLKHVLKFYSLLFLPF